MQQKPLKRRLEEMQQLEKTRQVTEEVQQQRRVRQQQLDRLVHLPWQHEMEGMPHAVQLLREPGLISPCRKQKKYQDQRMQQASSHQQCPETHRLQEQQQQHQGQKEGQMLSAKENQRQQLLRRLKQLQERLQELQRMGCGPLSHECLATSLLIHQQREELQPLRKQLQHLQELQLTRQLTEGEWRWQQKLGREFESICHQQQHQREELWEQILADLKQLPLLTTLQQKQQQQKQQQDTQQQCQAQQIHQQEHTQQQQLCQQHSQEQARILQKEEEASQQRAQQLQELQPEAQQQQETETLPQQQQQGQQGQHSSQLEQMNKPTLHQRLQFLQKRVEHMQQNAKKKGLQPLPQQELAERLLQKQYTCQQQPLQQQLNELKQLEKTRNLTEEEQQQQQNLQQQKQSLLQQQQQERQLLLELLIKDLNQLSVMTQTSKQQKHQQQAEYQEPQAQSQAQEKQQQEHSQQQQTQQHAGDHTGPLPKQETLHNQAELQGMQQRSHQEQKTEALQQPGEQEGQGQQPPLEEKETQQELRQRLQDLSRQVKVVLRRAQRKGQAKMSQEDLAVRLVLYQYKRQRRQLARKLMKLRQLEQTRTLTKDEQQKQQDLRQQSEVLFQQQQQQVKQQAELILKDMKLLPQLSDLLRHEPKQKNQQKEQQELELAIADLKLLPPLAQKPKQKHPRQEAMKQHNQQQQQRTFQPERQQQISQQHPHEALPQKDQAKTEQQTKGLQQQNQKNTDLHPPSLQQQQQQQVGYLTIKEQAAEQLVQRLQELQERVQKLRQRHPKISTGVLAEVLLLQQNNWQQVPLMKQLQCLKGRKKLTAEESQQQQGLQQHLEALLQQQRQHKQEDMMRLQEDLKQLPLLPQMLQQQKQQSEARQQSQTQKEPTPQVHVQQQEHQKIQQAHHQEQQTQRPPPEPQHEHEQLHQQRKLRAILAGIRYKANQIRDVLTKVEQDINRSAYAAAAAAGEPEVQQPRELVLLEQRQQQQRQAVDVRIVSVLNRCRESLMQLQKQLDPTALGDFPARSGSGSTHLQAIMYNDHTADGWENLQKALDDLVEAHARVAETELINPISAATASMHQQLLKDLDSLSNMSSSRSIWCINNNRTTSSPSLEPTEEKSAADCTSACRGSAGNVSNPSGKSSGNAKTASKYYAYGSGRWSTTRQGSRDTSNNGSTSPKSSAYAETKAAPAADPIKEITTYTKARSTIPKRKAPLPSPQSSKPSSLSNTNKVSSHRTHGPFSSSCPTYSSSSYRWDTSCTGYIKNVTLPREPAAAPTASTPTATTFRTAMGAEPARKNQRELQNIEWPLAAAATAPANVTALATTTTPPATASEGIAGGKLVAALQYAASSLSRTWDFIRSFSSS